MLQGRRRKVQLMQVHCPNCGFEDEGNSCSKCGSSLPGPDVLVEGELPETRGPVTWLNKCPVCKSWELLPSTKKSLLGLVTAQNFECNSCGLIVSNKTVITKLHPTKEQEFSPKFSIENWGIIT
jgi:hypothetical protein